MTRIQAKSATLVHAANDVLGESPWWSCETGTLWWVDPRTQRLQALESSPAGSTGEWSLPFSATAVVGNVDHPMLVGAEGMWQWNQSTAAVSPTRSVEPWFDPALSRTNDATTDRAGRVWVGWLRHDRAPGQGAIGVVIDGAVRVIIDELTMPNGLGWLSDGQTLVYVDTAAGTLNRVLFDLDRVKLAGPPTTLATIPTGLGLADGLAVDEEDCVWLAIWGAGQVHRYSPTGELLTQVRVPTPLVTSCAFGGGDRTQLFITTASLGIDQPSVEDGGLYVVLAGVRGLEVTPCTIV